MEQLEADGPNGSPLDTDRTATKQKRKPGPAKGGCTWSREAKPKSLWKTAEEMWHAGDSVQEISKVTGLGTSSIYAKATRKKWSLRKSLGVATQLPKTVPEVVERHVEATVNKYVAQNVPAMVPELLRNKIEEHFTNTFRLVHKLQGKVDELSSGRLEVEEAKSLSSSVEILDRVARRNLGLDSPGGQALAAGILCATVAPSCPIIEAEVIDSPGSQ